MPIEIPEHLRYRAPVPLHRVGEVQSRYREPKQYIDPELYYEATQPGPQRPPTIHNFRDVAARYTQPKSPRPANQSDAPLVPKSASILITDEYRNHKAYARAVGVNNVQSYWHVQPNMDNVVTKRQLIEDRQAQERAVQIKEGATFKVPGKAPSITFGELMERTGAGTSRANSPSRKSAHSVVMNWVNNGVPIPGKEGILAPTSPARRAKSPEKPTFVTGSQPRPRVIPKYAQEKEEKVVKILCENLGAARTRSPPRVAFLPPKYQAQPSPQRHRLSSPSRPRSNANNVMSKSPVRQSVSPVPNRNMESMSGSPLGSRRSSVMHSAKEGPPQFAAPRVPSRAAEDSFLHAVGIRGSPPFRAGSRAPQPDVHTGTDVRCTSPVRNAPFSQHESLASYNGLSSASARANSPDTRQDFLPFHSAPPPLLRGRAR